MKWFEFEEKNPRLTKQLMRLYVYIPIQTHFSHSLSLSTIAFCFVQSKSISICLSLRLKVYNKFNSQRNQSVASKLDASHGKVQGLGCTIEANRREEMKIGRLCVQREAGEREGSRGGRRKETTLFVFCVESAIGQIRSRRQGISFRPFIDISQLVLQKFWLSRVRLAVYSLRAEYGRKRIEQRLARLNSFY